MKKLEGKKALITGGTSGIGLAAARLFKKEGAQLIITGRNAGRLASAQKELGDDVLAIQSNACNLADISNLFETAKHHFNHFDILFLNAAIANPATIEHVSEASFNEVVDANFKGVFFSVQKALPCLSNEASIIITTSITNQLGSPNFIVYGATKAAQRSLVKSLGLGLISKGIRINAISPGPIDTPLFDHLGLAPDAVQKIKTTITQKSPIQRFGTPEEVAKVALFLACNDSSYITGQEIVVDGGMSLL